MGGILRLTRRGALWKVAETGANAAGKPYMKRPFLTICLLFAVILGVAAALATGGADDAAGADDMVVLGELDFAERLEIWRNQYRRMTPGDIPLVQDVGTWPAAWELFSSRWTAAPAERDLATWLVPVVSERSGTVTVLRDADGNALWSGATDFAKEGSESVTLTGALVSEEDWALWEAARAEIDRRLGLAREETIPMRGTNGPYTNGLRFTNIWVETNGDVGLHLAWDSNSEVQVFCRAMHTETWTNTVIYTNDENEVVTNDFTQWRQLDTFRGRPDAWEALGVVTVTNGGASFIDTNIAPDYDKVRFYAAAEFTDTDDDGLTDGEEWLIVGSDPELGDTDFDGIGDLQEYIGGTSPTNPDTDGDGIGDAADVSPGSSNLWLSATMTNEFHWWKVLGTNIPTTPQHITNRPVVCNRPTTNSVVHDVRISGFVDDIICVDSNVVGGWYPGTTNFVDLSVFALATNVQSGRFTLGVWDLPDTGYVGTNEVKLGYSYDDQFRVEWDWWRPFEVLLEPVLGGTDYPLDNPSGIIQGSNAWFHVDVLPSGIVPATNIVWTPVGDNIELTTTNRGLRVQVCGNIVGECDLRVEVEGAVGGDALPPFHVKVVPLTLVTAKVGVVEYNGAKIAQDAEIVQMVAEANGLLSQLGLQVVMAGAPTGIPDPYHDYYDLDLRSNTVGNAFFQELSQPGGLEIYVTHAITDSHGVQVHGIHRPKKGIAIVAGQDGLTLAHEIAHACGLPDIYASHPQSGHFASGTVSPERLPGDWGCYGSGTTGLGLECSNLVSRLLMHGHKTAGQGDIPTGACHGVSYLQIGPERKLWYTGNILAGWGGTKDMPPTHDEDDW